jgi:hypothetical protein
MTNKVKILVDSIYHHIQRINKDTEWRPEGNTSCLGYGVYVWDDGRFNPSIERYSRNSCTYPDINQYSTVQSVIKFLSDKEIQTIVNLLKKFD